MKAKQPMLNRFFPFLTWLKGYNIAFFGNDALAGLTVAVVLIPQAMAYAMLAGMPPVYGLSLSNSLFCSPFWWGYYIFSSVCFVWDWSCLLYRTRP